MHAAPDGLRQLADEPLFHRAHLEPLVRESRHKSDSRKSLCGRALAPPVIAKSIAWVDIVIQVKDYRHLPCGLRSHDPKIEGISQAPLHANHFAHKIRCF